MGNESKKYGLGRRTVSCHFQKKLKHVLVHHLNNGIIIPQQQF